MHVAVSIALIFHFWDIRIDKC